MLITKNTKILMIIFAGLCVVFGLSMYAVFGKIDSVLKIIGYESEKKQNDISKLFLEFSKEVGLVQIANTYQHGCEKPASFSSLKLREARDGFRIKCELYAEDKLVVLDNIALERSADIDVFSGGVRGSVDSIRLSASFPNIIQIPDSVSKYASIIGCEDGSALGGKNYYKVSLPSVNPFFASFEWSCGSGGCWNIVEMSKVSQVPKSPNRDELLKPGESSTLFPESGWTCG
jgi:hypothetical protein